MTGETIHCVFAVDDRYARHLAVALASLLANNRRHGLDLHVVHAGLTSDNIARLTETCQAHGNAAIRFHEFDATPVRGLRLDGHIKPAAYFRLLMSEVLPVEIERVIYLDADLVVLDDILPLWRWPLDGYPLAAAPNLFLQNRPRPGLRADHVYFNSGVLVADLAAWRREGLTATFLDFARRNQGILRFHDQDVLNMVLHGRTRYLDYRWNFQARTEYRDVVPLGVDRAAFRLLRRAPGIIHYTTGRKPWYFEHDTPYEREYLRYRRMTPWHGERQAGRTLLGVVRRVAKRPLRPIKRAYLRLRARKSPNLL